MTNKYAEGYPGKRYYGRAASLSDKVEQLAIDRAKQVFGCTYRQCATEFRLPGEPGRVMLALLTPGDVILGHDPWRRAGI